MTTRFSTMIAAFAEGQVKQGSRRTRLMESDQLLLSMPKSDLVPSGETILSLILIQASNGG